jgi:hypothetical protein
VALVSHSYFVRNSIRGLAAKLEAAGHSGVRYWKALNDACDLFHIATRRYLWVSFATALPVLSFFLFEIVGSEYPFETSYTVVLPLLFTAAAMGLQRLLKRKPI